MKSAATAHIVWKIARETVEDWLHDSASRLAAAVSFYTIFSVAPLLVISIAVGGFVMGPHAARASVFDQIRHYIGPNAAEFARQVLSRAHEVGSGATAVVLGVATLFVGAVAVFNALQSALNVVWNVRPRPGRGIGAVLKDRLLAFAMILVVGVLLLAIMVASAALSALGSIAKEVVTVPIFVAWLAEHVVAFGFVMVLFAMIYKILPDAQIRWRDVWIGAALTALLFTLGTWGIGLYLGRSTVASVFGAAGSFVVILIWVYYSAQIFFMGAELTQVYARHFGTRIEPDAGAISEDAAVSDDAQVSQAPPQGSAASDADEPSDI